MSNQSPLRMEELRVLQVAETLADSVWDTVKGWPSFDRDTVGKQLVRATDSIGANIAEAFGRFYFGEKLRFLYYARGSLFETKYWLNRARQRGLVSETQFATLGSDIGSLVRQLNAFANVIRRQRHRSQAQRTEPDSTHSVREPAPEYITDFLSKSFFTSGDIEYLMPDI